MSGIRDPMTTSAISLFVVFAVIHPASVCVSQSGICIPPGESDFFGVKFPCFKEEVECEWYRREGSEVDEIVFPLFVFPDMGGGYVVWSIENADDV